MGILVVNVMIQFYDFKNLNSALLMVTEKTFHTTKHLPSLAS